MRLQDGIYIWTDVYLNSHYVFREFTEEANKIYLFMEIGCSRWNRRYTMGIWTHTKVILSRFRMFFKTKADVIHKQD